MFIKFETFQFCLKTFQSAMKKCAPKKFPKKLFQNKLKYSTKNLFRIYSTKKLFLEQNKMFPQQDKMFLKNDVEKYH